MYDHFRCLILTPEFAVSFYMFTGNENIEDANEYRSLLFEQLGYPFCWFRSTCAMHDDNNIEYADGYQSPFLNYVRPPDFLGFEAPA